MADTQGTHRHLLDPSYGVALWMLPPGLLKDRKTCFLSVSVSWVPTSAGLFEKSFWNGDASREGVFYLV